MTAGSSPPSHGFSMSGVKNRLKPRNKVTPALLTYPVTSTGMLLDVCEWCKDAIPGGVFHTGWVHGERKAAKASSIPEPPDAPVAFPPS